MIKANVKYTAREILEEAAFDVAVIGTMRVMIGGLNVSSPEYVIRVTEPGTLLVVVGVDSKELEISEVAEEAEISEAAKAVKEAEGLEATEKREELLKKKAEEKE